MAAGLNLLRNWHDVRRNRYGLVGYSAGAAAILRGLGKLKRAKALSFISPPLSALETTGIGRDKRPRQFVIGAADRIVDPAKLGAAVEEMRQPVDLQVISGAGHTIGGYEREVATAVGLFMGIQLRR